MKPTMSAFTVLVDLLMVVSFVSSGLWAMPVENLFNPMHGTRSSVGVGNSGFPGSSSHNGGGYRHGQSSGSSSRWNSDSSMGFNRGYDYDNKRHEGNFFNVLGDKTKDYGGGNFPRRGVFGEEHKYNNRYHNEWKSKDGMFGGYSYGSGNGPKVHSWSYGYGTDGSNPGRVNFVHMDSDKGIVRGQAPADSYFKTFPGSIGPAMEEETMRNIHNIRMAVERGMMHSKMFHDMMMPPDFRKFMMDHI